MLPFRSIVIAFAILTFSVVALSNPIPLSAGMLFPDISYASVTGSDGVFLNPASLFLNKNFNFEAYHGFAKGESSGDNALSLSAAGAGFGYQRLSIGYHENISRYDIALSSRIIKNVYTGLSYTYYKTLLKQFDKAHSWNYSVLAHVGRVLAVSAEAQNINKQVFLGEKSAIGYIASAAVRPFGERLTFGINVLMYGGRTLSESGWRASARFFPRRGLAITGGYDNFGSFGVGLELQFGKGSVGGEGFFDNGANYQRGTVYLQYSIAEQDRVLIGSPKVLHVDISGEIPEEKTSSFPGIRSNETLYQKLNKIREAKSDPRIKGILLTVKNPKIGWAKLSEFRREISDFKLSGKPVICYLGLLPGNRSYYLATVANKIYMLPVDALNFIGLRAQVTFYKGTLDKLGIVPEFEKIGKYKNFPNEYTDTTMVPPHRESIESLMDDLYSEIVNDVSEARHIEKDHLKNLIDSGPFNSAEAESLGLIDGRFYPYQFEDKLQELFGDRATLLSTREYKEVPQHRERFGEPPQLAIITVSGGITTGTSGYGLIDGKTAGSATISRAIRAARSDPAVKAIVLRLDTPGGDALASDLIWAELLRTKAIKPIVVSMSDVCASGGYYVASASDKIFVDPMTITGSIGVFNGKPDMEGFYRKLGIKTETITRGNHADMNSYRHGYSDEERTIIRKEVSDLYQNFISIVATNRSLSKDSVDAIGQGRVWTGRRALALGLADKEGTILDAIEEAKQRAEIHGNDYLVIEMPERRKNLLGVPDFLMAQVSTAIGHSESLSALRALGYPQGIEATGLQMKLPYDIVIE